MRIEAVGLYNFSFHYISGYLLYFKVFASVNASADIEVS